MVLGPGVGGLSTVLTQGFQGSTQLPVTAIICVPTRVILSTAYLSTSTELTLSRLRKFNLDERKYSFDLATFSHITSFESHFESHSK